MTERKTDADVTRIFDLFVDHLTDLLKNGEEVVTKDGDTVRVKPSAANASNIRQFLKDQKVQADPDKHPGLKELAKATVKYPFALTDDETEEEQRY